MRNFVQRVLLSSSWLLINSFAQAQTTSASSADALNPAQTSSSASVGTATINGTPTTYRDIFTVPAAADSGVPILPNIQDPQAIDVQTVCPGYVASNVVRNAYGLNATLNLAGPACNVYGTDLKILDLAVQYQSGSRLSVKITPSNIVSSTYHQSLSLAAYQTRRLQRHRGIFCLMSLSPNRP